MTLHRALAAAQTTPIPGDVATNVDQHLSLAELAVGGDARTVLFPELSLTGYELELASELAFTAGDPRLRSLRHFARTTEVTLIAGAPVRLGASLYIGALILLPSGDVDLYTKHHLGAFSPSPARSRVPPPESSVFDPGTENPLVPCGSGTASIAVCADIGRDSHARLAADRGADTYLASAFLIPEDYTVDAIRLEQYATRHGMAVCLANFGGPTGGMPSAGGSAIWSANGNRLVTLAEAGAGVALAVETGAGWHTEIRMLEDS